ncbi:MAG: hypothetical protein QUV05_10500 [Phycisphaerae bacterium]|nr:hypothetical protein [Phycisphaerae bacterium]
MDQLDYYRKHPPRCVKDFKVHPVILEGAVFDGHGSDTNPVFSLHCLCGHARLFVLGHYWRNPYYGNKSFFVDPLALQCEACGKVTGLFDGSVHGYDPECCDLHPEREGLSERVAFECEECGRQPFVVFARFEYPDDLFNKEFDGFRGREQDLFTWFSLLGICSKCSRQLEITDFECS